MPLSPAAWPPLDKRDNNPETWHKSIYSQQPHPKLPYTLWRLRYLSKAVLGHAMALRQGMERRELLSRMAQKGDKAIPTEVCLKIFGYVFQGSSSILEKWEVGKVQFFPYAKDYSKKQATVETVIEEAFAGYPNGRLRRIAYSAFVQTVLGRVPNGRVEYWIMEGIDPRHVPNTTEVERVRLRALIDELYWMMRKQVGDTPDMTAWLAERGTDEEAAIKLTQKLPLMRALDFRLSSIDEACLLSDLQAMRSGRVGSMLHPFLRGLLTLVGAKNIKVWFQLAAPHEIVAKVRLGRQMSPKDVVEILIQRLGLLCEHIRGREQHEREEAGRIMSE